MGGDVVIGAGAEPLDHHAHEHAGHGHARKHDQSHAHDHNHAPRTIDISRSLLEKNDRLAEQNRGFFRAKQLFVLNIVSSPGSGKTTLISKTASAMNGNLRMGVITGDLATDNDAARLRRSGIPVVQITTGTVCHLDAEMIARAAEQLDLDSLDVLVIENVGNLVCPADFDLGESCRVVLLSVTEGEDKPLKYPPIFHSADVVLVTKGDLADAVQFDREQALANLKRISHHARILELSAKTGEGVTDWLNLLRERQLSMRQAVTSG
jgi:hydrogenase nickel incorporation protein HypB